MPLPFYSCPVSAGYPSPAQDYTEDTIDLNAHLVHNPAATFFMRVVGGTLQSTDTSTPNASTPDALAEDVQEGDILIVDRSLTPRVGSTVVAHIDGKLFVRRIERYGNRLCLVAMGSDTSSTVMADSCELWGVVTYAIHVLR